MSTWQQDRIADFDGPTGMTAVSEWGETITRGSLSANCEKTPDVADRILTQGPYQPDVRTTIDMLTVDFNRLGLALRTQFTCGGVNYEVYKLRVSASDPIAQFDAVRVK